MRFLGLFVLALVLGQAQSQQPPLPYVDHGACPFECCVYRDWIAERTIQAFDSAPMATQHEMFSIAKGERVTAMTGTVITRQAGVVRIRKAMEGCAGILAQQPRSEWWVKVRNRTGHIGWVRVPTNAPGFSRMDGCGGER